MSPESDRVVQLGEISGVHGVRGWVRVHSYTDPRTNLFDYPSWLLEQAGERMEIGVEAARIAGRKLIAKLVGIDDRDRALGLVGAAIGVRRSHLPAPEPGEYYWTDLEGLAVVTRGGERLGRVERLIATGAHDVLVLDGPGERMIPFVPGEVIERVDLEAGEILVAWDASYWE